MQFTQLLAEAGIDARLTGGDSEVDSVWADSRKCGKGTCFVALAGCSQNGHEFIPAAISSGVSAIVCEDDSFLPSEALGRIPCAVVADSHEALGRLSQAIRHWPGRAMTCIGITGTNGKSTIAHLVHAILTHAGHPTAMLGTISYQTGQRAVAASMTTPTAENLAEMMAEMVEAGITHLVMETSSHALDQKRTAGLDFRVGVFTNLTGDHLDYHKTLEEYLSAKCKLFAGLSAGATAVINREDPYAQRVASSTAADVCWYGCGQESGGNEIIAKLVSADAAGTVFEILTNSGKAIIRTSLIGHHNTLNCLAAAGACLAVGVSLSDIAQALGCIDAVPGRLQRVTGYDNFQVFVDYAHTDDALANVTRSLRPICKGRLIVVFGCGGDRDKTKRPRMAKVAGDSADLIVVTSDNPRSERPGQIIDDILAGFDQESLTRTEVQPDRRLAIRRAIELAQPGDIVLIAGKGHETYQIINGVKTHFDDVEEARMVLTDFKNKTDEGSK